MDAKESYFKYSTNQNNGISGCGSGAYQLPQECYGVEEGKNNKSRSSQDNALGVGQ